MARLNNDMELYSSAHATASWTPGVWRRMPWTGGASLIGAVLGIVAAIAVLVRSDGALISDWKYPPTVYLSVAYTISNILLNTALSQGVTISWWRKAMADGTQLGDLHRYYDFGTSAFASFLAGRHFNFIAFVALFVTVTPINGPLLQRSTSVATSAIYSAVDLQVPATRRVNVSTGIMSGRGYDVSLITDAYAPVVQAYYNGDPIQVNATGCAGDGVCSGRLAAAGWAVNCSSYLSAFSIEPSTPFNPSTDPAVNGTKVFISYFGKLGHGNPSNLSLNVQYKNEAACAGNLIVRNCSFHAATVQYPIIVDGNSSTITLDPNSTIFDDVVLDSLEYQPETWQGPTMLGGYALALQNRFDAWSNLRFVGAVGYELTSQGPTSPQFAVLQDIPNFNMGFCNIRYTDPTDFLLRQARELMFRTALAAGNSSNLETVAGASQVQTTGVYRSHYLFLGIAVAVSIVAVVIVFVTFRGFWHLGRNVTLSPVEVAKAFNAPLLSEHDSNAEVTEIVKQAGTRAVRYGAIADELGMGAGKNGEYVQVHQREQFQSRLEIADAREVRPLA